MCKRASLGGVAVDANSSARRARLAPLAWAPALERPASHQPPRAAANLRMKTIAALAALAISLGSRVRNFADSEFGCAYVSVTALVALPTPAPALASLPRKPRPFTVQVQAQTLPTAPCFIYDDDKVRGSRGCGAQVASRFDTSVFLRCIAILLCAGTTAPGPALLAEGGRFACRCARARKVPEARGAI